MRIRPRMRNSIGRRSRLMFLWPRPRYGSRCGIWVRTTSGRLRWRCRGRLRGGCKARRGGSRSSRRILLRRSRIEICCVESVRLPDGSNRPVERCWKAAPLPRGAGLRPGQDGRGGCHHMRCGGYWLKRLLFVVTLVAGSAHFLFLLAQTTQEGAQALPTAQKAASDLVLKSTVNRVLLDVVVTDTNGRPVRGLTAKDFSVAEDGRAQEILAFDVHSLETASDFAKLPPLPANTYVNIPPAPERGPLYVLLLDLVNSENTDEPYARRQLLNFIGEKPKGTRVAIFVLSDGLHFVQGFTDDEKQLYAVLDRANPRPHIPRIFLEQKNFGKGDVGMMVSVVTNIGRFLDGLPGRKNLLWFAGDFPLTLSPTDDVKSYQDEIKGALDTLAQAQVAVYPVDIRGVVTENAHAAAGDTGGGGVTTDYRNGSPPAGSGSATVAIGSASADSTPFATFPHDGGDQGNAILMQSYRIQDEVAKITGGRGFHSNNGMKDLLEEVVEDGANYYTVTYSPSNHNFNGAPRAIRVELANRGYQLSYRRSYYGTDLDALKTREEAHGAGA